MSIPSTSAFNELRWRVQVQATLLSQAQIIRRVFAILSALQGGQPVEGEILSELSKEIDKYLENVSAAIELTEGEIERLENA